MREGPVNSKQLSVLAVIVTALPMWTACKEPVQATPPPPEVYVTEVVKKDVPTYLEIVGQTAGFQDVEIRARVEGFLETMSFREGSFVTKGEVLYEIDRQPHEPTLGEARAGQATAEA